MIGRLIRRRLALIIIAMACLASVQPQSAHAAAGLQLNPLKYEDSLATGHAKSGFIDVSNPNDTAVQIQTSVQGFRQSNLAGDLAFFVDPAITAGIVPGLASFQLGPREAIRVAFTVDPDKLPQGGVYAAIFFRTIPPAEKSSTSFISESANVGTLLILQNGGSNAHIGAVSKLNLPFWQFGTKITGTIQYQNTNRNVGAIAFNPVLVSRVFPWGRPQTLAGPFIMPSSTRQFELVRNGSFLGLLPVSLTDTSTGAVTTRWMFAITGWYALAAGIAILWLAAELIWLLWRRVRGGGAPSADKPSLDGLRSAKKTPKKRRSILRKP